MQKKTRRYGQIRYPHRGVRRHFRRWSDPDILPSKSMLGGLSLDAATAVSLVSNQSSVLPIRMPKIGNTCPVCGYRMEFPPEDYNICPCCGTEFGYDDAGTTHKNLRAKWTSLGMRWWSPNTVPPNAWNALAQLEAAFGPESIGIQSPMYPHRQMTDAYQRYM